MISITDDERLKRIKRVFPNEQEARDILEYDKQVDQTTAEMLEYDLLPEQKKIAQAYTRTGTRKAPMIPNLQKREHKPNATKGGIIAELAEFFEKSSQFSAENVKITNKERQISFTIGSESFELTLVQKRKSKK